MSEKSVVRTDNAVARFYKFITSEPVQNRFNDIFGKDVAIQTSAIISLFNSNKALQECSPTSVISAAIMATTLKLPISSQLGYAFVVPYKGQAQFQIGWKGLVQLAIRSGLYETINTDVVRKNQLKDYDVLSGRFSLYPPNNEEVVGYFAYFKLLTGFEKMLYMSKEECESHAQKYSASFKFRKASSIWMSNFDEMAKKTVLRLLLNKFGIMSIEMRRALDADQAVITDKSYIYVDNNNRAVARDSDAFVIEDTAEFVDDDTGEVVFAETESPTS